MRSIAVIIVKVFCLGLLAVCFIPQQLEAAGKVDQSSDPERSLSASAHKDHADAGTRQEGYQLVYQVVAPHDNVNLRPTGTGFYRRANFEGESVCLRMFSKWQTGSSIQVTIAACHS